MSVLSGCSEEWIIAMAMIRCISEQLWGMTCNKHCCGAFIQIKWVLFPIAMNRISGSNPIYCHATSAELPMFWNVVPGGQGCVSRMWADLGCHNHMVCPAEFSEWTFVCRSLVSWVSVSPMRHRWTQPKCKLRRCDSKTISNFGCD